MSSRLAYLNIITEYLKYNIIDIQNEKIKLSEITLNDILSQEAAIPFNDREKYNGLESVLPSNIAFNDLSRYIQKLFSSILDESTVIIDHSTDQSSVDSHQISCNNETSSSNAEKATLSSILSIEETQRDTNKVSTIIEKAKQAFEDLRNRFILTYPNQSDFSFPTHNNSSHLIQNGSSKSSHNDSFLTQYSLYQSPNNISLGPIQNLSKTFLERSLPILFKMCIKNYFHYIQNIDVKLNRAVVEDERVQDIKNSGIEIINIMYSNLIKTFFYMNYQTYKNHLSTPKASRKYISFEDKSDISLSEKLDLDIFDFLVNKSSPFQSYTNDITPIEDSDCQANETLQNHILQFVKLLTKYKPELSEQVLPLLYKALLCTNKEEIEAYFASIEISLRPLNTIHQCFTNLVEFIKKVGLGTFYIHDLQAKFSKENLKLSPSRFHYDKSNWWKNFTHSFSKRSLLKSILQDLVKVNSAPQFYILLNKINDWSLGYLTKESLFDVINSLPQEINEEKKSHLRNIIYYEQHTHEFFLCMTNSDTPIYHPFAPLTQQNHSNWERSETPSYKRLPLNMPKIICSGRNKRLKCVLNDRWVSIPENSESSPKHLSTHEEALFRIEDLRYSTDMKIGRISSLLKFLKEIQIDLKVKEKLNEPYIVISPFLFSPIHKSILKEIYGFHTNDIINSVCQDPCQYLGILLSCLEDKLFEWTNSKQNIDSNYWRVFEQSHWYYILDGTQKNYHATDSGKRYFTRSSRHIDS